VTRIAVDLREAQCFGREDNALLPLSGLGISAG
jgi:hypothetical protein